MIKDICIKCGKCCHYLFNGKLKRCKFLKQDNTCKIYHRRIGTRIDKGIICTYRTMSPVDYPGCPYNTDKPILKEYEEL